MCLCVRRDVQSAGVNEGVCWVELGRADVSGGGPEVIERVPKQLGRTMMMPHRMDAKKKTKERKDQKLSQRKCSKLTTRPALSSLP